MGNRVGKGVQFVDGGFKFCGARLQLRIKFPKAFSPGGFLGDIQVHAHNAFGFTSGAGNGLFACP